MKIQFERNKQLKEIIEKEIKRKVYEKEEDKKLMLKIDNR